MSIQARVERDHKKTTAGSQLAAHMAHEVSKGHSHPVP